MNTSFQTILLFFVVNILISPLLIKILRSKGFYKKKELPSNKKVSRNDRYYKHLLKNMGTPSSFGILMIPNLLFFLLVFGISFELGALVTVAILLGLWGLADDVYEFFFYHKVGRWGIKARYKIVVEFILLFTLFFLTTDILIISLILGFFSTFVLNSFNITDGLDGLAGGLSVATFSFYAYMEYITYGMTNMFYIILLILSFLVCFLLFNVKPAKVFLGDSGSYTIGAFLAFFTFRYNIIFSLPVIAIFLLEGTSSFIQIFSIKVFRKKVFKIAPLHLHLLNVGWSQWKVILSFWILHIIIVGITFLAVQYVG